MKQKTFTYKLVLAAVCLALAMILPMFIGRIPSIGRALSPMHLPVLLCGFLAGPILGGVVGVLAPLLNSVLTGAPPLFPMAISMAFELAGYGILSGLFYYVIFKKHKDFVRIFASLILAMLFGRIIWGIAMLLLLGLSGAGQFTWAAFLSGAFIGAVPAIISQVILVPVIVLALKKAKIME
ncbi:ECF transporter S component [Scatolibacter rhodanostii]|uniref:ECF transporter S component n=1 Tax=Scatolibacter rhodanostii TaxID=2014781 RepID=UPI000C0697EC|nr:ECF transporter S component [Scatolibacter rhodanostii]